MIPTRPQDGLDGLDERNNETGDAHPIRFILHKMKNTWRHFTRNVSHNWLRQCIGQPNLRKRVRSQVGVGDSCFCSSIAITKEQWISTSIATKRISHTSGGQTERRTKQKMPGPHDETTRIIKSSLPADTVDDEQ